MVVLKDWEVRVAEERKNLWVVVTTAGKFVCKKVRGRFFVKDCGAQLPVKGSLISSEKI